MLLEPKSGGIRPKKIFSVPRAGPVPPPPKCHIRFGATTDVLRVQRNLHSVIAPFSLLCVLVATLPFQDGVNCMHFSLCGVCRYFRSSCEIGSRRSSASLNWLTRSCLRVIPTPFASSDTISLSRRLDGRRRYIDPTSALPGCRFNT